MRGAGEGGKGEGTAGQTSANNRERGMFEEARLEAKLLLLLLLR